MNALSAQQYSLSPLAGGGPPSGPVAALDVWVDHVFGVVVDQAGDIYFSSVLNCIFKLDRNGVLTRIAGNGQGGYYGDGGPAANAQLNQPRGLALDADGNMYVADYQNALVRKISKDGIISTVAGTSFCCLLSGDEGPALKAPLTDPALVSVDGAGNLYIGEPSRIRKVSNGNITTFASGFASLQSMALDSAGTLWIADQGNISALSPGGELTRLPGNFGIVTGITFDAAGNLIIADGSIYSRSPQGIFRVLSGVACCTIPGLTGGNQGAIAADSSNNVYIAMYGGSELRKLGPNGAISTVAGTTTLTRDIGDGGRAVLAQLIHPEAVAVDASGNVYIADYGTSRVRKVSRKGIITTVAGNGISGFSGDGGMATEAELSGPVGVAVDAAGNLFVSEYLSARIRRITPDGRISTYVGTNGCCSLGDGGPATQATVFNVPHAIAVDRAGNLYIADPTNARIRKVSTDGIITTIAGNGKSGFAGDGGQATLAELNGPQGVAVDVNGSVYVADSGNSRIRKIANGTITTIAQVTQPVAVAVNSAGIVYFTDGGTVWMISAFGSVSNLEAVAVVFGSSRLTAIETYGNSIAIDPHGDIVVANTNANQVQLLAPFRPLLPHE